MAQGQLNRGTVGGLAALQLLIAQDQAGTQPVEGMLAQTRSLLVVELGGVLAMPDCDRCRGLVTCALLGQAGSAARYEPVGPNGKISPFMGRRCQAHGHVVSPVMVKGAHAA